MQYLSSIILAWAPFLANPDFQILVMAAMTAYLGFKAIKKSLKILAATLRVATVVAAIGLVIYLFTGSPEANEPTMEKEAQTESPGQKVGKALALIKHASKELPSLVADLKASIDQTPPT